MVKLKAHQPRLTATDTRKLRPPPKTVDPHYNTPGHKAWRAEVMRKAGNRCQWTVAGDRCRYAAPRHRMFADHIRELRDGGAPFEPANGMCLCSTHHVLKTMATRARRMAL